MPLDTPTRARNDPAQYDDLAGEWWKPRGTFAPLHWLANARAALVPPPPHPGALLVDIGCGGGLLGPHVARLGYRVVGLDVTTSALAQAADHDEIPVRADAAALPLPDACADVVCAGEILEHVTDLAGVVAEACRVLRPGGTLVVDTIADTALAKLLLVRIAERIPRGAPVGLHDPGLFVNRERLVRLCRQGGVPLELRGLRPGARSLAGWLIGRRDDVELVGVPTTAVLFGGVGRKSPASLGAGRGVR